MFCYPFNSSIWSALLLVVPLGVVVFLWVFFSLKKGHYYFFDPRHNDDPRLKAEGVNYETLAKRYQDIGTLLVTLSTAAIGFLISIITADKPSSSVFAQRLQTVAPIVVGLFGTSVACWVLFMTVQALWYEEYCHSPDHDSYKRWKYAVSTGLGWTGLLSFLLAFIWLARTSSTLDFLTRVYSTGRGDTDPLRAILFHPWNKVPLHFRTS